MSHDPEKLRQQIDHPTVQWLDHALMHAAMFLSLHAPSFRQLYLSAIRTLVWAAKGAGISEADVLLDVAVAQVHLAGPAEQESAHYSDAVTSGDRMRAAGLYGVIMLTSKEVYDKMRSLVPMPDWRQTTSDRAQGHTEADEFMRQHAHLIGKPDTNKN